MTGSILLEQSPENSALWRDYWQTGWYRPVFWSNNRLNCFMTASQGRKILNHRTDEPMVSDWPRGMRPFLGVITNDGVMDSASDDSGILEYNQDGHLLTVAPTRAGKGTGQIIPNLLLYAGSAVVMDIKGENHAITHKHRGRFFEGARVLKFAPFQDDSDRYNPLDFIRVGPSGEFTSDTFDDARLLAEMLLGSEAKVSFWQMEARNVLTMLLLYVSTRFMPGTSHRVMSEVVNLLFPPPDEEGKSAFAKTLNLCARHATKNGDSVLAALATQFQDHDDEVASSILSTCRSGMSIWLSPRLQEVTSVSDFSFLDLKASMCRPPSEEPAPTTLYIMIPAEYLVVYRPVLRMLVGLATVEMTRRHSWATEENLAAGWLEEPPFPVLFLLDEFPSLGHMAPIEQGVAYLAGYGVQLWTFVQSLGQLKEIYGGNWTTFVANAGAACYYSMSDPDLCDYVHKQLGNTEEYAIMYNTMSYSVGDSWGQGTTSSRGSVSSFGSGGDSMNSGTSTSDNIGATKSASVTVNQRFKEDPVAKASEIRALHPEVQIIFMRNQRPVLASLVPYFRTELFNQLYGEWRR